MKAKRIGLPNYLTIKAITKVESLPTQTKIQKLLLQCTHQNWFVSIPIPILILIMQLYSLNFWATLTSRDNFTNEKSWRIEDFISDHEYEGGLSPRQGAQVSLHLPLHTQERHGDLVGCRQCRILSRWRYGSKIYQEVETVLTLWTQMHSMAGILRTA